MVRPQHSLCRNSARDPHWRATTFASADGGAQEVVDFTVTGTAGVTSTQVTENTQEHRFTVSGVPGASMTLPERPEITTFTFAGQGSDYDPAGQPSSEVWQFDVTGGMSDGTFTGVSEEFYICLLYTSPSPRD